MVRRYLGANCPRARTGPAFPLPSLKPCREPHTHPPPFPRPAFPSYLDGTFKNWGGGSLSLLSVQAKMWISTGKREGDSVARWGTESGERKTRLAARKGMPRKDPERALCPLQPVAARKSLCTNEDNTAMISECGHAERAAPT